MEGVKLKIKGKGNMPAFYLFYTLSFSYLEFYIELYNLHFLFITRYYPTWRMHEY